MRKSGEERREEIVQAVIELAASDNSGQLSTQAIADRVGIAQPTVFRHFSTREKILQAVIEWIARHLLGLVGSIAAGSGTAAERLQQLIGRQLEFISRHRGLPRLLFSERLHQDSSMLKASVGKVMDGWTRTVAGLIAEGREDGSTRADLDPEETARLILAMIQGLVMRWSISDFGFDLPAQAAAMWRLLEPALVPDSVQGSRR
jgi:TetR/AcrR family transcriptional regulator